MSCYSNIRTFIDFFVYFVCLCPGLILRNLGWKCIFGITIYPLYILINVSFLTLLFQEVLLELNKVYFLLENTIIQLSAVTFSTTVHHIVLETLSNSTCKERRQDFCRFTSTGCAFVLYVFKRKNFHVEERVHLHLSLVQDLHYR